MLRTHMTAQARAEYIESATGRIAMPQEVIVLRQKAERLDILAKKYRRRIRYLETGK